MEGFRKIITPTDATKRLELPTKALNLFSFSPGQFTKRLSLTDKLRRRWSVNCCKRQQGRVRPSLRRGWLDFVRANDIKVGDMVTFRTVDDDEFRIEVKRNAMRLFGQDIWVDVEGLMI